MYVRATPTVGSGVGSRRAPIWGPRRPRTAPKRLSGGFWKGRADQKNTVPIKYHLEPHAAQTPYLCPTPILIGTMSKLIGAGPRGDPGPPFGAQGAHKRLPNASRGASGRAPPIKKEPCRSNIILCRTACRPRIRDPLGLLWGPLGLLWSPLGLLWVPLGLLWGPLGLLWGPLGLLWSKLGLLWGPLGQLWGLLGLLWDPLGLLWGPLGLRWGPLGRLWGLLGLLWGSLGLLWGQVGLAWGRCGIRWGCCGARWGSCGARWGYCWGSVFER